MKTKLIWLLVITALASVAVIYKVAGGLATASAPKVEGEACQDAACPDATCEEEKSAESKPALEGLRLARVEVGEAWEVVTATGRVVPEANRSVKIGPRIEGKIVSIGVDAGDAVRAGQALATVSSVELAQARAAYRHAAAEAMAARDNYQRQVKLAELGAFSHRPVEEARADLMAAESDLADARSDLATGESDLGRCAARLARTRSLYQDEIVSRQDLEEAEAEQVRDRAAVEAARAKVKQAEARVEVGKTYLAREEKVLSGGLLASKEVQAAQAELTRAEVELRAAAETIRVLGASPEGSGDAIAITSPIAGRVAERAVTLGQMVAPSDTLFTVMELSQVRVEAEVYEKDLARVRPGQRVEVRVDAFPGRSFPGQVGSVSDALNAESRTARIRCLLPNADRALKPEMFATVSIITARRRNAALVPKAAVLDDAGKKIVFVACTDCEDACGEFDRREVTVGPAHDGRVEVVGVKAGDEVVTEGNYQLKTALSAGTLEAGCADE